MARWEEALDTQMTIHRFLTSPLGAEFGAGWFLSSFRDHRGDPRWTRHTSEDDAYRDGAAWAMAEGVHAFNAEPIYVEPDMMTLVEVAAQTFRAEPLHETDLITRHGLLVLPRSMWISPMPGREEHDHRLNWTVAHWVPRSDGITLTLYHDQQDPDDLDAHAAAEELAAARKFAQQGFRWVPTHSAVWRFGAMHPNPWVEQNETVVGAHDVQLQMQAIWRLLSQTISVHVKARPPRSFLKRALRAKLPTEHVTVVRLRRPASPPKEGEPEVVNWTHRWIVGAHWRWQWYRDDTITTPCGHIEPGGTPCGATGGRHRQIWIGMFQKGPAHLPLITNKARVFVLER